MSDVEASPERPGWWSSLAWSKAQPKKKFEPIRLLFVNVPKCRFKKVLKPFIVGTAPARHRALAVVFLKAVLAHSNKDDESEDNKSERSEYEYDDDDDDDSNPTTDRAVPSEDARFPRWPRVEAEPPQAGGAPAKVQTLRARRLWSVADSAPLGPTISDVLLRREGSWRQELALVKFYDFSQCVLCNEDVRFLVDFVNGIHAEFPATSSGLAFKFGGGSISFVANLLPPSESDPAPPSDECALKTLIEHPCVAAVDLSVATHACMNLLTTYRNYEHLQANPVLLEKLIWLGPKFKRTTTLSWPSVMGVPPELAQAMRKSHERYYSTYPG